MKKVILKAAILLWNLSFCQHEILAQNIYTIAGIDIGGVGGFSGDGGPAINAQLSFPKAVVADASGNIYIADYSNNRIRKINTAGTISTIAGTGVAGFSGDGSSAVNAQLSAPIGVAVDALGNVYIADYNNNRIRKVNTSGIISTFAGSGAVGTNGDGGAATAAELYYPSGVAVDPSGSVYITTKHCVRMVNLAGIISKFAGMDNGAYGGDGAAAINAYLHFPSGVACDGSGNVFIADRYNNVIRKVNGSGIISTYAGTGLNGFSGDGGNAPLAKLYMPTGVAVDALGNVYIADVGNSRVRKVNSSGVITTFAGSGVTGCSGDGGPATLAEINGPFGIGVDQSNNVIFTEESNHRIREVCIGPCVAGLKSLTEDKTKIIIFPNPAIASFKIQIDNEFSNGELILINSIGQKVYEQKIFRGTNEVRTRDLAKGLYNCFLLGEGQLLSNTKLIIN
jgi:sugar lactone lactonase YvrE